MLPDHIEVVIDIVPDSMIGWVRSGVRSTEQTTVTFHDTGHSGSTAKAERNFLHNGPMKENRQTGRMERQQVGYNFAVDDDRIIQLVPLNEETWAAGKPSGNRTSWHIEQCFGGGIDFETSLSNAIALHAGLIAAKGWNADSALVQHNIWTGKDCPGQVRNKGIWPSVLRRVGEAARGAGGTSGPAPTTFAEPVPIPELARFQGQDVNTVPAVVRVEDGSPFFFVGDRVKAIRETPRLQLANPNAQRLGPDLKVDEEFDVMWVFVSSEDNEAYYVTPFSTRVRVADTARLGDRQDADTESGDSPGDGGIPRDPGLPKPPELDADGNEVLWRDWEGEAPGH
jgi:hypothetical protein